MSSSSVSSSSAGVEGWGVIRGFKSPIPGSYFPAQSLPPTSTVALSLAWDHLRMLCLGPAAPPLFPARTDRRTCPWDWQGAGRCGCCTWVAFPLSWSRTVEEESGREEYGRGRDCEYCSPSSSPYSEIYSDSILCPLLRFSFPWAQPRHLFLALTLMPSPVSLSPSRPVSGVLLLGLLRFTPAPPALPSGLPGPSGRSPGLGNFTCCP